MPTVHECWRISMKGGCTMEISCSGRVTLGPTVADFLNKFLGSVL